MKNTIQFIKRTILGGVFFIIPVTVVVVILGKAHAILSKITAPLALYLPDLIFGLDGSFLISMFALLLLCFLGGLLLQRPRFKVQLEFLEENVLERIPGYSLFKAVASENLGVKTQPLRAVMIHEGDVYQLGLLVEENDKYSTVFIPGAPNSYSGEVKIFGSDAITPLNADAKDVMTALKRMGRGGTELLQQAEHSNSNKADV